MKFTRKDGLVWLSITLEYEGSNYTLENCILDTGSATTAIDIDLVDFNFQKPAIITRLFGIGGGTQEVISQKVDGVTIDTHSLKNVDIEFGNLHSELGINGFIGNDILSVFRTITIDNSKQEIEFTLFHERPTSLDKD